MRARRVRRTLTAIVLAAALLVLGFYYAGEYLQRREYIRYPLHYEELIVSNADEFSLEPWHIAAVIRCESSFSPSATSSAGARGLMQIMPSTGEWLSGKFGETSIYNHDMLYEAETNMKYGCWYLSWLMRRYDGDHTLVTAAYHAGHGTVDNWLKDEAVSPDGKTLSKIPYESTKEYVERVLRAYGKYQELYDFEMIRRELSAQEYGGA